MNKIKIKTKNFGQMQMIEAFLLGLSYAKIIEYKRLGTNEIAIDHAYKVEVHKCLQRFLPDLLLVKENKEQFQ